MNKAVVILLICTYALATMGFSLKEFYCCGKLQSVNLTLTADKKQNCDKGEGDGCCENKYQFYKVKDKHISSDKANSIVSQFTELNLLNTPLPTLTTFPAERTAISYSSHAPPVSKGISIYLFNCVFRI